MSSNSVCYHTRDPSPPRYWTPFSPITIINYLARAKSEALVNNTCKQKKLNRVTLNGKGNENGIKINRSN